MNLLVCKKFRGGGKSLSYLLCMIVTFGLVTKVSADEVVDLGGETVSGKLSDYEGQVITNGVLELTESPGTTVGTYTIGNGATVIYGSEVQFNDNFYFNILNGGTYKQTNGRFLVSFLGGQCNFTMDNGTFITEDGTSSNGAQALNFGVVWINNSTVKDKDISANVVIKNGSEVSLPSGQLQIAGARSSGKYKPNTLKVDFAVTNSIISSPNKQIQLGVDNSGWLNNSEESYVRVIFGPGADLTCTQIYAFANPLPSVVFDGATIHWNGSGASFNGSGASFIGHSTDIGDIYTIDPLGLTIDIPSDKALTCDNNASSLKGDGGITKIGEGSVTWNQVSSKGSEGMTFTGPLVVSNGTWTSSIGYAASALRADGGTLVLSGALSASDVELAATEGGTLTLSDATITDTAPSLTLAGGGTTDYFTRDAAVASYSIGTLTLGPGAVLDLDADSTGMDAISASLTNITATAESPIIVNMNFSAAPSTGQTFIFFEVDSADLITVVAKVGDIPVPYEKSIVDGRLVMTVSADHYTWNGTKTNWGDTNAWTKNDAVATWSDGNYAIFATANAEATLAADVVARKVSFTADATIGGTGTATLTAPEVSVDSGVSATISAATLADITKSGAGMLTLGASRTGQTIVTEGTLAMANGATLDSSNLTIGTDPEKSVTLDYGDQTLDSAPSAYLGAGMDITLTNGTFSCSGEIKFVDATFPAVLTVAKGATLLSGDRFNWNATTNTAVNVVGGTVKSTADNNNWFMQASYEGRLDINVTDGGLLEFGGETYLLTCRDGSDVYNSPELHLALADSTLRVANGKSIRFGRDSNTKPTATPVFTLAATNSVFDIGYGMYIGNDKTGLATAGSYTADFESCVITGRYVSVYADRTLNNALFNGSTIVFNNTGAIEAADSDSKWFTVGDNGLTLDTNGNDASLKANIGGSGAVTKIGSGKIAVVCSQTGTGPIVCSAGELFLNPGLTIERPVTVANGSTFTVKASTQCTVSSLTLKAGSTLNIDTHTAGVVPLSLAELTLPETGTVNITLDGGAFACGTYAILKADDISVDEITSKFDLSADNNATINWSITDGTLYVNVFDTQLGVWTGADGDGKWSTAQNWSGNVVPETGAAIVIAAANDVELECDTDVIVNSIAFYGAGKVTVTGERLLSVSNRITSLLTSIPVINASVEFVADGEYMPIDVSGKVDFQGGVTGTVPVNHATFYGNYTLTATSWTLSEAITLAENATVTASEMTLTTSSTTQLSAEKGASFKLQKLIPGVSGTIFADYAGTMDLGTLDMQIDKLEYDLGSGFAGTLIADYIFYFCDNATKYFNINPAAGAKIVIRSTGIKAKRGYVRFPDKTVLHSLGNWTFNIVNHNYDQDNKGIDISDTGLCVDTSNFYDSSESGYTVTVKDDSSQSDKILIGSGELVVKGNGTVAFVNTAQFTGGLVASNGVTVAVNKGVYPGKGNVTIKDTATLDLVQSDSGTVPVEGTLTMEGGSTLRLQKLASGVVPISAGGFAVSGDGKVTLEINGGELSGYHTIVNSAEDIADVVDKINLKISDDVILPNGAEVSLVLLDENKVLALNVDDPATYPSGIWVGGVDTNMSNPLNWKNLQVPAAGSDLDFRGAAAGATLNCDLGDVTFGAVTMGEGVVTFTGTLTATSFSDTSKVAVGENSTVTLDGDLEFSSGTCYITDKVDEGGAFVVTGTITITGAADLRPYSQVSAGYIVASGLVNAETTGDKWRFRLNHSNVAKWVVGSDGFSGLQYFWSFNNDNSINTIKADADFTIATTLSLGTSNGKGTTFDTTGWSEDTANYTITVDTGFVGVKPVTIIGGGKFICNYTPQAVEGKDAYSGEVTVSGTATLAINAGKYPTTGAITVNGGAALAVAESGTVTLGDSLALESGSRLGFNFTDRATAPVLDMTGKTVAFTEAQTTNVIVKVSAADALRPMSGKRQLTAGCNFTGVNVSLAEGAPEWVKNIGLDDEGNIFIDVEPEPFVIRLR